MKAILLVRRRKVVKGKVKPPKKDSLVGFLLDILIQLLFLKIPVFCFNLVVIQKILLLWNIFGSSAREKKYRNDYK
jgi:hypothetical protein